MIPKKYDAHEYDYPDFQPDQVLSADSLNHSFAFNEQQERLTRTNLIGIGIVCGLKVTMSGDGKTVYITKGTGVTSSGYLVVHGVENSDETIQYKSYRSYNVVQDITYDVFVLNGNPKYPVWELVDVNSPKLPGDTDLSSGFLSNKVCLMFYEMLEVAAKNCDATSCDDKGKTITVTVRKLLINAADADKIITDRNKKANAKGSGEIFPGLLDLIELRLPRFDVLATTLVTTNDVYEAYQKIFTKKFVEDTGYALNAAYAKFKEYLKDNSNPFSAFNSTFAFLHNGTIAGNNLLHFQYYYDFFCDLLMAYNEWRQAAHALVAMCTPPEALFPRHLLLWNFAETETVKRSNYRNYFIPSPILTDHDQAYKEFKLLYQRLARMVGNVRMLTPTKYGQGSIDLNIRITPSKMGYFPLGIRAIPFYYKPNEVASKLIDVWDYALTRKGKQTQILGYDHSYNIKDDFVKNPLSYDLEPYNFLRIEGHVGKSVSSVLYNIERLRDQNRLPFQYVAVSVDGEEGNVDLTQFECYFQDLTAMFEALKADLLCKLYKLIYCMYQLPKFVDSKSVAAPPADPGTDKTKRSYSKYSYGSFSGGKISYKENTLGQSYELLYDVMLAQGKNYETTIASYGNQYILANPTATAEEQAANNTLMGILHNVVLLKNGLDTTLQKFNASSMVDTTTQLKKDSAKLKGPNATKLLSDALKTYPCIDEIFDILCDILQFFALYKEYLERIDKLQLMVTLKKFAANNPGLQHKGGVPVGGTFVIVYRNFFANTKDDTKSLLEKLDEIDNPSAEEAAAAKAAGNTPSGTKAKYRVASGVKSGKLVETNNKVLELQKKGASKTEIEEKLGILLEDSNAKGKFTDEINKWLDSIVVADFYLPYACCSDCPPVQFTVNIPPPKVTFTLDKLKYCNGDNGAYSFHTTPTGGTITTTQAKSVVDNKDGTFSFLPSFVKMDAGKSTQEVIYTYTVEDQMQSITVTIDAMPAVTIIATPDPVNPLKIQFTFDKPDFVDTASWNFGDPAAVGNANTSTLLTPTHIYAKGGTYSVTVNVTNGECSDTPAILQLIVKDPDPVVVTGFPTELCKTAADVNFTVKPAGGTFTGEGVTVTDLNTGKYKFSPAAINMSGLPRKTVPFIYTAPAGNSNPAMNAIVNDTPSGAFLVNANQATRAVVLNFTALKNTEKIKVDFGDGTPAVMSDVNYATTFNTLSRTYAAAGQYTIKAFLINGSCVTPLQQNVGFQEVVVVTKTCQPASSPINDYTVFRTSVPSKAPDFFKLYKTERLQSITDFMSKLNEEIKKNPAAFPVSFFQTTQMQIDWVIALPALTATEGNNTGVTNSASLQLASILTNLVMVYECNNTKDIDDAYVNILNEMNKKLQQLKRVLTDAAGVAQINQFILMIKNEIKNVAANGETGLKSNYVKLLTSLINALGG